MIVLATLAFVVIYANNQQCQIQETQTEAWPTAPGPYNQPCRAWISGRAGYPGTKGWLVSNGMMTVDEAVAAFGTIE